jgi:hypothetical protein
MDEESEITVESMTPDEFDLAFEAALPGGTPVVEVPEVAETPVVEVPEVAETPVVEVPEVEKATAPAKVVDEVAEAQRVKDLAQQAQQAKDLAQAAADKLKAERTSKEQPTAEEAKALEEFGKDFPDVAKALDARVRIISTTYENRIAELEAQLGQQIDSKVAPVFNAIQPMVADNHTKAILAVHADAMEKLPALEQWVSTQPSFLKEVYNRVLDKGTAPEVIELIDHFKTASGSTQAKGPSAEDLVRQQAEKADKEEKQQAEKADKEKKLQAQEGVRSRQSGKTSTIPADFDNAFDMFAAQA